MPDSPKSPNPRRSLGAWLAAMPRWKKILCAVAAVCLVAGVVFTLTSGGHGPATGSGAGHDGAAGSFVPTGGSGTGSAQAAEEPTSKGFFRMGFSFFAGLAIGYFARSFLKMLLFAAGAVLLAIFALQYFDLLPPVNWTKVDELWNSFAQRVESEAGNFTSFITGSLPATALAGLGLVAGFKRH